MPQTSTARNFPRVGKGETTNLSCSALVTGLTAPEPPVAPFPLTASVSPKRFRLQRVLPTHGRHSAALRLCDATAALAPNGRPSSRMTM